MPYHKKLLRRIAGDQYHGVFVSSTFKDLRHERQSLIVPMLSYRFIPIGMELWPTSASSLRESIARYLEQADFYVLLIGARYGQIPNGESSSYTEIEYDLAVASEMPILAFHCDVNVASIAVEDRESAGASAKLAAFINKIRDHHGREIRRIGSVDRVSDTVLHALVDARRELRPTGLRRVLPSRVPFAVISTSVLVLAYLASYVVLHVGFQQDKAAAERASGSVILWLAAPACALAGCLARALSGRKGIKTALVIGGLTWIAAGMTCSIMTLAFLGRSGAAESLGRVHLVGLHLMLCCFGSTCGLWIGGKKRLSQWLDQALEND